MKDTGVFSRLGISFFMVVDSAVKLQLNSSSEADLLFVDGLEIEIFANEAIKARS